MPPVFTIGAFHVRDERTNEEVKVVPDHCEVFGIKTANVTSTKRGYYFVTQVRVTKLTGNAKPTTYFLKTLTGYKTVPLRTGEPNESHILRIIKGLCKTSCFQTSVIYSNFLAGRASELFPNPLEFKPERWLDTDKNGIHPYASIPFGLGPRMCIGEFHGNFIIMVP